MEFGLRNISFVYPDGGPDLWANVRRHVQQAEADGWHTLWVMDHFGQLPAHGSTEEPFFDAWTILPALAAITSTIRLGPMVSPVGYRNPSLLARMAATLDHLSNGRLEFGFGAGGYEPEYRQYGYPFPLKPSIRLAQMEEALRLIIALWTKPRVTFQGQFFQTEETILEPKPVQKPYPPILIGGTGPKITLRILAELGDGCNLWGPPDRFEEQKEILQRHCHDLGRDISKIKMTTYDLMLCAPTNAAVKEKISRLLPHGQEPWMTLVGTPDQLVNMVGRYQEAGADQLCLEIAGNDPESYALFTQEVMPHFQV